MTALKNSWNPTKPYFLNQDLATAAQGLTMLVRHGDYFMSVPMTIATNCSLKVALTSAESDLISGFKSASVPVTYYTTVNDIQIIDEPYWRIFDFALDQNDEACLQQI